MAVYFDNSTKGELKGGVSAKQKRHNRWRAEIQVNGRRIRLGRFIKEEEAWNAYHLAKLKYLGVGLPEFLNCLQPNNQPGK